MDSRTRALAPTPATGAIAFAGCLTAYVHYDCVHYFLHHDATIGAIGEREGGEGGGGGGGRSGWRRVLSHTGPHTTASAR
eukprot:18624-Pelagococcus_subviridis.AAC.1